MFVRVSVHVLYYLLKVPTWVYKGPSLLLRHIKICFTSACLAIALMPQCLQVRLALFMNRVIRIGTSITPLDFITEHESLCLQIQQR